MREFRSRAEKDLLETTLSGANVAIYGWIKKLGTKHHHAIEMDDENSWRDRLAFVVDNAMYYVSEKRRDRELVCDLDDIRHVEVGNGWSPGYFTFKVYLARDPEDGNSVKTDDLPLDSLPSRVFSTSTLEDCRSWVTVLSRGMKIQEEQPASYASSMVDSSASSEWARVLLGGLDYSKDTQKSPDRKMMNGTQTFEARTGSPTPMATGIDQVPGADRRQSIDSIHSNLHRPVAASGTGIGNDRKSLDLASFVTEFSIPSRISTDFSPPLGDSVMSSDGIPSRWLQESEEASQHDIKRETMFPGVRSEWRPAGEARAGALRPLDPTIELDDKE